MPTDSAPKSFQCPLRTNTICETPFVCATGCGWRDDPIHPNREAADMKDDSAPQAAALLELADRCREKFGKDACWPWRTGKKGKVWVDGKIVLVSRFMLADKLGRPIKPKMMACHTCDNPPCFNPDHLYEGTHADNMRDMKERRRTFAARQPEAHRLNGIINGRKNDWTKGERNPKAVLSLAEVNTIRSSKTPTKRLAEHYEVHRTTIQRIRRGAQWAQ